MPRHLSWKKILTREYSFLYASYAADCFKIMRAVVGTTLEYDFFYGEGGLLTIYRIEADIQRSYRMLEKIAKKNPEEIVRKMDTFDQLIQQNYVLFAAIKKSSVRVETKKLLLELDKTFLHTLCYYLFFVFLGYAGDQPAIARFLRRHGRRFKQIRTYTIDTDMHREYPKLFGAYDHRLKPLVPYMTRRELIAAIQGKLLTVAKIRRRQRRYLVIMRKHRVVEYPFEKIDHILSKELAHLAGRRTQDFVVGQVACWGNVRGVVRVIFSKKDYRKIQRGDIIVTPMTKPTIVPYLSKVKGIVTNDGGALSHASIISREMKIPCIVGTIHATDVFKNGDVVRLDTGKGVAMKVL
ncbi:MAG: pyruvate, water dikinase [Parcubacteria group bacterium Gr01-1014_31]|nr:MAG: pyruvate, water dikinase [Parcubacteria group bacterium Gr01-1014_31]